MWDASEDRGGQASRAADAEVGKSDLLCPDPEHQPIREAETDYMKAVISASAELSAWNYENIRAVTILQLIELSIIFVA